MPEMYGRSTTSRSAGSRVSLGNYHLGERRLGISPGSSRKPRCRRDTGCHLHPGMQRSRLYLGRHRLGRQRSGRSLGSSRNPRCQRDAEIYARSMQDLCEIYERSMQNRATLSMRKSRNLYFGKSQYSRDLDIEVS